MTKVQSPFDVVVVGNVGIDTNVYLYGEDIDWSVEGNFSENIDYIGQAGGYTSRMYAALGYRTAFVGHVGADVNGRFIRDTFAQDGIDTTALGTDPTGTARSVNIMYRDGRRKNFYDGKGHMQLEPDWKASRRVLAGAKLAHFHLPNWARHLLPVARELGVTIACDIQDVVDVDDAYRREFVEFADVVFFSAVNYDDPTPLMTTFRQRNANAIMVVGMGARGCALGTPDGIQFFPPVTMAAAVVDSNGAGDGLASGFLSGYVLDGLPLDAAVQRGQLLARTTCTLRATTDMLPTKAALMQMASSKQA